MSENTDTVIVVFVISLERVGLSGEKVGGVRANQMGSMRE